MSDGGAEFIRWFSETDIANLKSGVGCPMCKHEGPHWTEACRIHSLLHALMEDHQVNERALTDLVTQHGKVLRILGLDWDDDPVSAIEDLHACIGNENA